MAIILQLAEGVSTRELLVIRAVEVADQHSIPFTSEEATSWIAEQRRIHASGELSDTQL